MLTNKIIFFFLVSSFFGDAKPNEKLFQGLLDIEKEVKEKKQHDNQIFNQVFNQRTRTQLIARDAVLISMELNSSFYKKEILQNAQDFDGNLSKMLEFKKELDKIKKLYPQLIKEIDDLNHTWAETYKHIKDIVKHNHNQKDLDFIEKNNDTLLIDYSDVFKFITKTHVSHNKLEALMLHNKELLNLNIGLPKVLVTKIIKDRLLIHINLYKKESMNNFKNDVAQMNKLMKALKDGDESLDLVGTENEIILKELAISQKVWLEIETLVKKEKLTKDEILLLIDKNSKFIKVHTDVVKTVYESVDN